MCADSDDVPREAYGRVSHPERYLVLHQSAVDQIDRLVQQYSPDRTDGADLDPRAASAWPGSPAVRLTPRNGGAPITFTFTPFPGIMTRFGHGGQAAFPACGCDACDEDPTAEAYRMAGIVADVVAGGLSESRNHRMLRQDTYEWRLTRLDGSGSIAIGPAPVEAELAGHLPSGSTRWVAWSSVP